MLKLGEEAAGNCRGRVEGQARGGRRHRWSRVLRHLPERADASAKGGSGSHLVIALPEHTFHELIDPYTAGLQRRKGGV
ncbi:hypothetical protein GMST_19030 [Geomonas silvestris]|uniref:Uncharacterized protein n=1 Tax=Geomonas silvestris TaxID=2740184 RepID=A0A6V8MHV7_9BACT|nr:hypothetical protein GMST_19030 [Geomonas silvestris]